MVAEMNLDYEAIEHLKLALSRLSKAKRLLQNELMKVESCNNNRLSRSVIEESYVAAIDTLNSISFALEDIKSVGQNDLSDVSFDKTLFDFEPSYDENFGFQFKFATVYKGNIIKNLIMDCQSYTKYRPNETTGGIFVSWRRKEELPTGA